MRFFFGANVTDAELIEYAAQMIDAPMKPEPPYDPSESIDEQLAVLDQHRAQKGGLGYSAFEAAEHLMAVAPDKGDEEIFELLVEANRALEHGWL